MLQKRSYKKELLDADNIPFDDIKQNMKELDTINTLLGGHAISVSAFKKLARGKKTVTVCEIGCGGGDNLLAIERFATKNNITVNLIGIDIKKECIDYAMSRHLKCSSAKWVASSYQAVKFESKPDIIFSSLFCHHFTNQQLVDQLAWMKQNSLIGFFINDLHRNSIAYYSIKTLTALFSSSYLVKNDAPLSVARGFKKQELLQLCAAAGLTGATVIWKWAFRFIVMYRHGR